MEKKDDKFLSKEEIKKMMDKDDGMRKLGEAIDLLGLPQEIKEQKMRIDRLISTLGGKTNQPDKYPISSNDLKQVNDMIFAGNELYERFDDNENSQAFLNDLSLYYDRLVKLAKKFFPDKKDGTQEIPEGIGLVEKKAEIFNGKIDEQVLGIEKRAQGNAGKVETPEDQKKIGDLSEKFVEDAKKEGGDSKKRIEQYALNKEKQNTKDKIRNCEDIKGIIEVVKSLGKKYFNPPYIEKSVHYFRLIDNLEAVNKGEYDKLQYITNWYGIRRKIEGFIHLSSKKESDKNPTERKLGGVQVGFDQPALGETSNSLKDVLGLMSNDSKGELSAAGDVNFILKDSPSNSNQNEIAKTNEIATIRRKRLSHDSVPEVEVIFPKEAEKKGIGFQGQIVDVDYEVVGDQSGKNKNNNVIEFTDQSKEVSDQNFDNISEGENNIENIEKLINEANSFEELISIINNIKEIKTPDGGAYEEGALVSLVGVVDEISKSPDSYRKGHLELILSAITEQFGINKKVRELYDEAVEKNKAEGGAVETSDDINKKKESIILEKEQQEKINEKLKQFGLKPEDLEQIEGFDQLSFGQRLLVLENLGQIVLGSVHDESRDKYNKDVSDSGFLSRVWKGITKKYQITKLEKQTVNEIQKGGLKAHKEVLQQLVKGTIECGVDVKEKDGKLEVQYVSDLENLTPEQEKAVENFNQVATEFSKIPAEWRFDTATEEERKKYDEANTKYEKAKAEILKIKQEQCQNEKEALLYLAKVDCNVAINQFLNTHPEAEKELKNIDSATAWARLTGDVLTERGIMMASGAVVRSLTVKMAGIIGLPVAAFAIGGFRGWQRAEEDLQDKEKLARKGVKDKSAEAKNVVEARGERNIGKEKEAGLIFKMEKLMDKIDQEKDPKEKEKLINSLRTRIEYTEGKLEDGLIDFGGKEERIKNYYDLNFSVSKAKVFVGRFVLGGITEDGQKKEVEKRKKELYGKDISGGGLIASEQEELDNLHKMKDFVEVRERLDSFLGFKDKKISDAQRSYKYEQAFRGAVFGALFSVVGQGIAHGAEHVFGHEESDQVVENMPTGKTAETESLAEAVESYKFDYEDALSKLDPKSHGKVVEIFHKMIDDNHEKVSPENVYKYIASLTGDPDKITKEDLEDIVSKYGNTSGKIGLPTEIIDKSASDEVVSKSAETIIEKGSGVHEESLANKIIPNNEAMRLATISKGHNSVESVIISQLKSNPSEFGFKGDPHNIAEVDKWAGGEAHRVAIKDGYFDSKTGQSIGVGSKGVDKVAYVLSRDSNGNLGINEYLKDSDGNFVPTEMHESGSVFEGTDKDSYEYIHEKATGLSADHGGDHAEAVGSVSPRAEVELTPEQEQSAIDNAIIQRDEMKEVVDQRHDNALASNKAMADRWNDFVKNQPEMIEIAEKTKTAEKALDAISHHAMFGHVKHMNAQDFLARKSLNDFELRRIGGLEPAQAMNLRNYFSGLERNLGSDVHPFSNETIEDYTNRISSEFSETPGDAINVDTSVESLFGDDNVSEAGTHLTHDQIVNNMANVMMETENIDKYLADHNSWQYKLLTGEDAPKSIKDLIASTEPIHRNGKFYDTINDIIKEAEKQGFDKMSDSSHADHSAIFEHAPSEVVVVDHETYNFGDVRGAFDYGKDGEITGFNAELNQSGLTGSENLSDGWMSKVKTYSDRTGSAEQLLRGSVTNIGRNISGYEKLYKELLDHGNNKEADFVLKTIHNVANSLNRRFDGEIVDMSKIPALKK